MNKKDFFFFLNKEILSKLGCLERLGISPKFQDLDVKLQADHTQLYLHCADTAGENNISSQNLTGKDDKVESGNVGQLSKNQARRLRRHGKDKGKKKMDKGSVEIIQEEENGV